MKQTKISNTIMMSTLNYSIHKKEKWQKDYDDKNGKKNSHIKPL